MIRMSRFHLRSRPDRTKRAERLLSMKQRRHLPLRNAPLRARAAMAKLLRQQVTLPDLAATQARFHSFSQSQLADLSFVAATPSPFRSALALADADFRHPTTQPV